MSIFFRIEFLGHCISKFGVRFHHVAALHLVKENWRYSPWCSSFSNRLFSLLQNFVSKNDFVPSCLYMPTSYPFELFTGLEKQMPFWYFNFDLFACAQPKKQATESGFPMNCQQVVIIMKSTDNLTKFQFSKIWSCWC